MLSIKEALTTGELAIKIVQQIPNRFRQMGVDANYLANDIRHAFTHPFTLEDKMFSDKIDSAVSNTLNVKNNILNLGQLAINQTGKGLDRLWWALPINKAPR